MEKNLTLRSALMLSLGLFGAGCGDIGATGQNGTPPPTGTTGSALSFQGEASGSQALPPTSSDANAEIKLTLSPDQKQLSYTLTTTVKAATAFEIHQGAMGQAGDTVFKLDGSGSGTLQVTSDQVAALMAGDLYLNIVSSAFASGELRAQIFDADQKLASGTTKLSATLSGLQELDVIVSQDSGSADLTLDEATGELSFTISHTLSAATAVDLKQGGFGAAGNLVLSLAGGGNPLPLQISGKQVLSAEQRILLKSGLLYLEIASAGNVAGKLRGQILSGSAQPFAVALKAAALVQTSAQGTAFFFLSQDQQQISFRLSHDAQNVTSAAIVKDTLGLSTTVVCTLGSGQDQAQGTCDLSASAMNDLHSGLLKVVVDTQAHAQGEISGAIQLPKQK